MYKFTITGQRGTLWWHAHISWLRATVYGAIVILPKPGVPYPFPAPDKEVPIMFGEWWTADTEAVISQALQTGGGPNVSDAFTINSQPGDLFNCSQEGRFLLPDRSLRPPALMSSLWVHDTQNLALRETRHARVLFS